MKIENVYERLISLLAGQFQGSTPSGDKTNLQKVLFVVAKEIQELEDQNYLLKTMRSLNDAEGVQLDGLGEILALPRNSGESDDNYRERLKFQSFINNSNGTPEEVIKVIKFLTDASKVWYHEYYPAAYQVMTNGLTFPTPPQDLVTVLKGVSPASIQYVPITAIYDWIPFSFSTDPILELFYVIPDSSNPTDLVPFEVNFSATDYFLEVNRGQTENPILGGYFSEADSLGNIIDTEGSGQFAEVITFDGNQPI